MGVVACSDSPSEESDPDASVSIDALACAPSPDAGPLPDAAAPVNCLLVEPEVGDEKEGTRTFADVTQECDRRNGYTQATAACSGTNACAGFSYGDWDPGVTTEHSCAGSNGCNGISCIVLPADHGLTGKQVYEYGLNAESPNLLPDKPGHPRACTNCHGGYDEATKKVDRTKFKVYFGPGDTRTLANWKEGRSPAEQARIIAFGVQHHSGGMAYASMAAYKRVFSRAEIERAVEYIRNSLEPIAGGTIKLKDK